METNYGYSNRETFIVAESIRRDQALADRTVPIAQFYSAQTMPTNVDYLELMADSIEIIVTDHLDGQLEGRTLVAALLRTALQRVNWKQLSWELLRDCKQDD